MRVLARVCLLREGGERFAETLRVWHMLYHLRCYHSIKASTYKETLKLAFFPPPVLSECMEAELRREEVVMGYLTDPKLITMLLISLLFSKGDVMH